MSLDGLVENLKEDDFKIFEKEFPDKWQYLNKKLAHPYEYFNSIDDYYKHEEYTSVTYGCIFFIDSYRFFSSSLHSLVKTLVDNSHKTLKDLEEEIVDNDEILNIVNETNIIKEDRYNNDSIKVLKKDYPNKIIKLEEALLDYIGENDLKNFKTEIPDNKWKYLTKKNSISI